MPQVPTYEASLQPRGLPDAPGVSVPQGAFGEGVAQGLVNAGGVFADIADQERAEADKIAVTIAETKLNGWNQHVLFDAEHGVVTKQGSDAFNLPDKILPEFDKEADRIGGELKTHRQKLAFWELRAGKRVQLNEALNRHEFAQREVFYDDAAASAIKDSVRTAGNLYNDPKAIREELQRQIRVLKTQANRKGWDPEQLDNAIKDTHSLTHLGVIERMMATGEKKQARIYFEEVRDQIRGDHATEIEKAFRTDDGSNRESLRMMLTDVEAAARSGVPIKAIPSQSALVEAFGDDIGSRLYDQARQFVDVSRDVAKMHLMSADELQAAVEGYKPTQVEGAAAAAERQQIFGSSASHIMTEREKGRASYLVANNPTIKEHWDAVMEGKDPEAIAAYMQVVESEGDRLGIINQEVVPDTYANQLVADITVPKTNEGVYAQVNREAERWGPLWPKIVGQIASKLPDTVAVIASGIPPQAGIALSSMVNTKTSELKMMVPNGLTWQDVEDKVSDKFRTFLNTFPPDEGGIRTANAVLDSGIRLALFYSKSGSNLDTAVDVAYAALGAGKDSEYGLAEFHGVPYRYPSGVNDGLIQEGARRAMQDLKLTGATQLGSFAFGLTEEESLSMFQEYVREHGYWRTRADYTGLDLYVDGAPVPVGRGKISYTWMDLIRIGEKQHDSLDIQRMQQEEQGLR